MFYFVNVFKVCPLHYSCILLFSKLFNYVFHFRIVIMEKHEIFRTVLTFISSSIIMLRNSKKNKRGKYFHLHTLFQECNVEKIFNSKLTAEKYTQSPSIYAGPHTQWYYHHTSNKVCHLSPVCSQPNPKSFFSVY